MTVYSLGLLSLGQIINEESSKDSGLFKMPIPMSDSPNTFLLDLFGVTRTITVKGKFTINDCGGGSYASVAAFLVALDGLANGIQTKVQYTSRKNSVAYWVYIQTVNWSADAANVNQVDYIISLIEGS